jgi:glycosyltransferase involved in cell wall biosynthesis
MPLFSIVIPTFNRADRLAATVLSVLSQTLRDFEVLVIDDGSKDHTERVVSGFADPRVRYEWAPNSGGPATPRNRGLHLASAPWVSFLDADDIWYPTRLKETALAIEQNSQSDVFCHYEMLQVIGKEKFLVKYGPYTKDFYRIMLEQGNRLSTSAVTLRTSFLRQHGIDFNQAADYVGVEDYDLWLHLAKEGAHFTFIATALGEYVIHNENISSCPVRMSTNNRALLREHVYRIQQFEIDKDKLWRYISVRLKLEEARVYLANGHAVIGLKRLLREFLAHPWYALKIIFIKLQHKSTF